MSKNESEVKYNFPPQKVLLEPAMTEDDVEELLEKAQELQSELNELHQQRMSKSDNADEKLVMFRKQVNSFKVTYIY